MVLALPLDGEQLHLHTGAACHHLLLCLQPQKSAQSQRQRLAYTSKQISVVTEQLG